MRDIYKNPVLYYIAVPVLVGLWPLLLWAIYLPAACDRVGEQMDQYQQSESIMMEILALDPERLEFSEPNETDTEFTYDVAVDRVARLCDISAANCDVRTGVLVTTREQKSQSANVDLKEVNIVKFAKFLSMIQLRWVDLQCESAKLTRKENLPGNDIWDVDIRFKYYY
ncbi:MAG: hypothetical protein AMJ65_16275 [Phycisphaerae bacterium SG8_4]|nr:MAG: hypothetical protein AMJ65_16275 [Phycisphaerae bacterium SG8_4]